MGVKLKRKFLIKDDGLNVIPKPSGSKPDDKIAGKIKDAMFIEEQNAKNLETSGPKKEEFMGKIKGINYDEVKKKTSSKPKNPLEEIEASINDL